MRFSLTVYIRFYIFHVQLISILFKCVKLERELQATKLLRALNKLSNPVSIYSSFMIKVSCSFSFKCACL